MTQSITSTVTFTAELPKDKPFFQRKDGKLAYVSKEQLLSPKGPAHLYITNCDTASALFVRFSDLQPEFLGLFGSAPLTNKEFTAKLINNPSNGGSLEIEGDRINKVGVCALPENVTKSLQRIPELEDQLKEKGDAKDKAELHAKDLQEQLKQVTSDLNDLQAKSKQVKSPPPAPKSSSCGMKKVAILLTVIALGALAYTQRSHLQNLTAMLPLPKA